MDETNVHTINLLAMKNLHKIYDIYIYIISRLIGGNSCKGLCIIIPYMGFHRRKIGQILVLIDFGIWVLVQGNQTCGSDPQLETDLEPNHAIELFDATRWTISCFM